MSATRICFVLASALTALTVMSCTPRAEGPSVAASANPAPANRTQTAAFDHRLTEHAKVACENCHARSPDDPASPEPHRPPHSACSDCHSSENYLAASVSEPLCGTCHPASQILDASLKTRLLPFPGHLQQFGVAAFSHRVHADEAKMSPHPAVYGCGYCHAGGTEQATKSFPGHAECYSCHIHQAGQKLGRCQDCHAPAAESMAFNHGKGAAGRDYNFQHSSHAKSKDGSAVACDACHALTAEAPKISDIALPEPARGMRHKSDCWGTCHIQKEETHCGKCHVSGVPRASSLTREAVEAG